MATASNDASFVAFVQDQLQRLGDVECRPMFGGHGLYRRGVFFGVIFRGRLYFKTDDTTRPHYRGLGMKPFRPSAKQTLKNYYEVPADILEDSEQCVAWATQAAAIGSARRR